MNNGLWTTDRKPTSKDAPNGYVWTTTNDRTGFSRWDAVKDGVPWMPMLWPDPYEKPKRYQAEYNSFYGYWVVFETENLVNIGKLYRLTENNDEHRRAAERIAEAYEEMMP